MIECIIPIIYYFLIISINTFTRNFYTDYVITKYLQQINIKRLIDTLKYSILY